MRASIYVQQMMVEHFQTYAYQFLQEVPQIERLSLEVENADARKTQTVGIKVFAHYQDGTQGSLEKPTGNLLYIR